MTQQLVDGSKKTERTPCVASLQPTHPPTLPQHCTSFFYFVSSIIIITISFQAPVWTYPCVCKQCPWCSPLREERGLGLAPGRAEKWIGVMPPSSSALPCC